MHVGFAVPVVGSGEGIGDAKMQSVFDIRSLDLEGFEGGEVELGAEEGDDSLEEMLGEEDDVLAGVCLENGVEEGAEIDGIAVERDGAVGIGCDPADVCGVVVKELGEGVGGGGEESVGSGLVNFTEVAAGVTQAGEGGGGAVCGSEELVGGVG